MMDYAFQPDEGEFHLDSESLPGRWEPLSGLEPRNRDSLGPIEPSLIGRFEPSNLARRAEGEPNPKKESSADSPAPTAQPAVPEEAKSTQRGPTRLESLTFGSKSEAVCGLMLEKYVPGFQLIPGETFQIGVGSKRFDFKIDGVFIEFHPVQLRNDFTSQQAYHNFQSALGRLPEWQRNDLSDILSEEFGGQYAKRRRDILNCFEATKNAELIICHDREDFVRRVLKRFGRPGIPSETKLLREFEALHRRMYKRFQHDDPGAAG